MMIRTLFLLSALFFMMQVKAQYFWLGEKTMIRTDQIIQESYFALYPNMKASMSFALDHSVSYIQFIHDNNHHVYQAIFQNDDDDNLICLGIDKRLLDIFKCHEKSTLAFEHCVGQITKNNQLHEMSSQLIDCLMTRLNACQ